MTRRRWQWILLLWLMATGTMAQGFGKGAKELLLQADSLIYHIYYGTNIDTAFIRRPETRWTLKLRDNLSGATVDATGLMGDRLFKAHEYANFKNTVSVGASYMGLSLSLAVNPSLLLGRYKDYELNLTSYGNRFGIEFVFQHAKNFTGWIRFSDEGVTQRPPQIFLPEDFWSEKVDLPNDMLKMSTLNVNAYYAFNHRRFSYPAAFSQSYIQKKSAGSWMLGISYQGMNVDTRAIEEIGNSHALLKTNNAAVGAGYGYNFALPHQWLLHVSAIPTVIIYNYNSFFLNDEQQTMSYTFPEVIVTGRGSFVHTFDPYFCGLSMVYTFSTIGDENRLQVDNSKWRARAFLGFRF